MTIIPPLNLSQIQQTPTENARNSFLTPRAGEPGVTVTAPQNPPLRTIEDRPVYLPNLGSPIASPFGFGADHSDVTEADFPPLENEIDYTPTFNDNIGGGGAAA